MKNAELALQAMTHASPITIGQMALLDLHDCRLVLGEYDDLPSTLYGLWLLSMPFEKAVQNACNPDGALVWGHDLTPEEYRRRLKEALDGIAAFWRMLPRAEDDAKKKTVSGTGSSPSSPSSSAGPTPGASTTSSASFRPSRRRSCGAAGRIRSGG